jgi:hypothetical protein
MRSRSQVGSCGYEAGCRTLIRMRSQVQVLAGPPAKALPERPPATPLDHLARRQPNSFRSGAACPAASRSTRQPASRLGRLLQDRSASPRQQLRVVYRQVEDPAGSLAASTRPDLAWRARLSGASAETPAQPGAHSPPAPPSQRQPQIGSSGGIARPLTKWSLLGRSCQSGQAVVAGSDRPRGLWGTCQRPAWCQ